MAGKNFETRFFDLLEKNIGGIESKVDDVRDAQTKMQTSVDDLCKRIKKVERKVFKPSPVMPLLEDRKLLYLTLTCTLVFLLIIASIKGVKIPTLGSL